MVILWGAKFFWCPFFVDVFLKCFAAVFLKCFVAGGVPRLALLFFEMFCCGGVPRLASPILFAPAGVTENKES